METGLIFNIQRFSLDDGPGIRTTVFLKGCPLQCAWCHNPEGISPRAQLIFVENRCIGCGQCRAVCRFGAFADGAGPLPAVNTSCVTCGDCVEACPTGAREMVGRRMTTQEALDAVLQDRVFFEESGGGVTFSGGEPLAQPGFLIGLLRASKAQGLHTAIDTSGMAPLEQLMAVAPLTDLFLYDIKLFGEASHRFYTGASNTAILGNLRALGRVHEQIWVRIPIVPGVNDDPAELESIAQFVAGVPGVRQVNLLPFHRTGLGKSPRVGASRALDDLQPPSPLVLAGAVDLFRRCGLAITAGGGRA